MMQIGLEQIIDIGDGTIIDPKKLICSICCCVNIKARECLNKKCQKLICETCYLGFIKRNVTTCPFCRLSFDYTKADQKLLDIVNTLKLYCEHNTCKEKYTINEYINLHKNSTSSVNKCVKCGSTEYRLLRCNVCASYSCLGCKGAIVSCYNCSGTICQQCCEIKVSDGNILCGLCSADCQRCKKDAKVVCAMCDLKLCKECVEKCEDCNLYTCKDIKCYKAKSTKCNTCNNLPMDRFYNRCVHQNYLDCVSCYPICTTVIKGAKCINRRSTTCANCNRSVCTKDCSLKCKSCKATFCKDCIKFCAVCKKYNCVKCLTTCDMGCSTSNSVTCRECNIDTIRQCNTYGCSRKLCLNCWNVCNTCNTIYCKEHSVACINCEENTCERHCHKCPSCSSKDDKYKLLCVSRCTNICSFCEGSMNALCNPKKHNNITVTRLNCGHTVCTNCHKTCGKCKKEVISCQKCIVNFYFHKCKYCDIYLCSVCSKYCQSCEDIYCSNHSCSHCGKKGQTCSNCENALRSKCFYCGKGLNQCKECSKKYFCSALCYRDRRKAVDAKSLHLCEVYCCSGCGEKIKEKNLDKHYLDIGNNSSVTGANKYKKDKKVKVNCGNGACDII
jgi:hypothetical protein